jgi:hypothetical protein
VGIDKAGSQDQAFGINTMLGRLAALVSDVSNAISLNPYCSDIAGYAGAIANASVFYQ